MTILDITTGQTYATLSAAISGSGAGDVIEVSAGLYTEDFPKITHSLTIRGIGGLAHLMPLGQPSNGQGVLVIDAPNVTLDHLEISGSTVPDGNGAGIRFETGTNLTITNSWLHDNQNGLLANAGVGVTITIDHSEFNNNGTETGFTHNIYVGEISQLLITNSYIHDALGGHEIKSRADTTVITGNRIQDGALADTSYSIDLPNGGNATISNNIIEKGPNSANGSVIHYGGELNPVYANSALAISGNSVIDNRTGGSPALLLNQSTNALGIPILPTITGNTLYGLTAAQLSQAAASASGNIFPGAPPPPLDTSHPFTGITCFVAGTRLHTPAGEIEIDALVIGDRVTTHSEATDQPDRIAGHKRRIRWIGRRSLHIAGHPRPWDMQPVRILAHAFGPGRPTRDLRLSPDHAVYVDGVLIPVRYLINGATVVQETVDTVTYYHVELADADDNPVHDVVLAHGLPTESFLDTGNRTAYANGGPVVMAHPDFALRVWAAKACAPLVLDGPQLANARTRLLAEAALLGHATTARPDLHLLVDGVVVEPDWIAAEYGFVLPEIARETRLVSRTTVPSGMCADSNDTRDLGVAVSRIILDGIPIALDDPRLTAGWHQSETNWRWTNGAATLPCTGGCVLEITVLPIGSYWLSAAPSPEQAAAA